MSNIPLQGTEKMPQVQICYKRFGERNGYDGIVNQEITKKATFGAFTEH